MSGAVAVTGMGSVIPAGRGLEALWSTCAAGGQRLRTITHFDPAGAGSTLAGLVDGASDLPAAGDAERIPALCRMAIADALADAGLPGANGELRAGLVVASTDWHGVQVAARRGGRPTGPDDLAAAVARSACLSGPVLTVGAASAAGCVALGVARDLLRAHVRDTVVVCGADTITESGFYGLAALRALSPRGCRPFHRLRAGIHVSECAAALVLERAGPDGRVRGRVPRCWLEGAGSSNVASQAARPEVEGVRLAVERALEAAGRSAGDIDYVNAHAPGTRQGDRSELLALAEVVGARLHEVPVVSSKAALGHCQGAAGVIEAVVTALTLARGQVLPTLGLDDVDPEWRDQNFGQRSPESPPSVGLSVSCGLGGANAAVVLAAT